MDGGVTIAYPAVDLAEDVDCVTYLKMYGAGF